MSEIKTVTNEKHSVGAGPSRTGNALPIGMVEEFEQRYVIGWVEAEEADFPVKVSLWVNDLEVASTWADEPSRHNTSRTTRGFRIFLKDIWQFCTRADRVTVRVSGRPLPISRKGTFKRPGRGGGTRSLEELRSLLERGHVFSQVGRLQLSKKLDLKWQSSVLGLYHRVAMVVREKHGYDAFVIYGTLLGLVRENGFIGHDIDFDAAYVSRHRDGPSAAAELRDIAFTLIDAGFDVECRRTALHVHDPSDHRVRIDLFDLFFNESGELSFPFGIAGTGVISEASWRGVMDAELAGHPVRAPVDAEMLVEHIYGSSWRTPIAGFNWDRARTRRAKEGWTPLSYSEEVYWANFYARNELAAGSTFFEAVSGRDDVPRTVVDIGCGDGRDTFAFARKGFRAIGIDRSHVGIRHASEKAEKGGLEAKLSFMAVDVADISAVRVAIAEARKAANDGPLLYYLRFFLHSVTEEVQTGLMNAISDVSREGDFFAAEFRTEEDAETPKVYGGHYRRYQNGKAFGAALRETYGFAVLHEEEGRGLSPFKGEDPVLYRVIAQRSIGK